jgi:hypothetical protein
MIKEITHTLVVVIATMLLALIFLMALALTLTMRLTGDHPHTWRPLARR